MAIALGLHWLHPSAAADRAHILGFQTTRSVADDPIFDLRAGSGSGTRVLRINKDGQIQGANGAVGAPTYSFESDKDIGLYRIGANNLGVSIAGVKLWDWSSAAAALTGTLAVSGIATFTTHVRLTTGANLYGLLVSPNPYLTYNAGGAAWSFADDSNEKIAIGADRSLTVHGALTVGTTSLLTGIATAAAGVLYTGGSFAAGKVYKDATSGLVVAAVTGSGTDFALVTPSGAAIMSVPTGTDDVTCAGDILGSVIRLATADASDNGLIQIFAASALGATRSASVQLHGNEHANTGQLILAAGAVAGGHMLFQAGGAERMRLTGGAASGGILALGTTFVTGAVGGELVLPNDRAIRGVNAAGNALVPIISVSANNRLRFGGTAARTAVASAPAFSADFYLHFEDAAGNNFYVPGTDAAW